MRRYQFELNSGELNTQRETERQRERQRERERERMSQSIWRRHTTDFGRQSQVLADLILQWWSQHYTLPTASFATALLKITAVLQLENSGRLHSPSALSGLTPKFTAFASSLQCIYQEGSGRFELTCAQWGRYSHWRTKGSYTEQMDIQELAKVTKVGLYPSGAKKPNISSVPTKCKPDNRVGGKRKRVATAEGAN